MRKSDRLKKVHEDALRRLDLVTEDEGVDTTASQLGVRARSVAMRRFVNIPGAQWDWDVNGDFRNRIRMEVNKVALACTRIKNEYRNNRVEAKFLPSDGSDADDLADQCAGRFRADTASVVGRGARDTMLDEMVDGGFGAVRLRVDDEYEGKPYICLEPINDAALSVYFDPNSTMEDKSDARWCVVITAMTREAYEAEYGETHADVGDPVYSPRYAWETVKDRKVAEYFVVEDHKQTVLVFEGIDGKTIEEIPEDEIDDDLMAEMEAQGYTQLDPIKEEVCRVVKYVISGSGVLEDRVVIPGKSIPVVPAYAHRTVIEGKEYWHGHPTQAMDAQILLNLQVSMYAYIAAKTGGAEGRSRPVVLAEQVLPFQKYWDGSEDYSFLPVATVRNAAGDPQPMGPLAYTQPMQIPPAVEALAAVADINLKETLGNPENAEQIEPNTSGKAISLIQGRIDMQTFGYIDAMAKAERRIAEVWLGMAAEVYSEYGRKLKIVDEDDNRASVEVGKPIGFDKNTGKIKREFDLSQAEFDIEVEVGPTSSSKRAAVVNTLGQLVGQIADPQTQQVISHQILMNIEGEGMGEIREWSRMQLVRMGVVQPNEEEKKMLAEEQQGQQPDPQTMLAGAMAQEATAKAQKAEADTGRAVAETEKTKAETAKTLAEIPIAQQKAAIDTAKAITEGMSNG